MLSDYMTELQKIKLLTPAEEKDLWQAYKASEDGEARMTLIEQYQPLAFREAWRFKDSVADLMDIIQEGTVGLIEAVERFAPEKGVAFSLFAVHRIRGRILDYLRKEGKTAVILTESLDNGDPWWEQLPADTALTDTAVEKQVFLEVVIGALRRLPAQERTVMEQVYLGEQAISEVADGLDTSRSYIHRLHRRGIKRLRGILSRTRKDWK